MARRGREKNRRGRRAPDAQRRLNRIEEEIYMQLQFVDEAMQVALGTADALVAVRTVMEAQVREIEALRNQMTSPEDQAKVDALVAQLRQNRDTAAAMALKGTPADAGASEDVAPPQTIEVQAAVPGQPSTIVYGGKELPPFPSDGWPEDVDMSTPRPSPGIEPTKPE